MSQILEGSTDDLPFGPPTGPDGNPLLADPTDVPEPVAGAVEPMDGTGPTQENR
jgi:hypothetical protein